MALFRRLFYRKPPDRLVEICERTYVFDCCLSADELNEDEYKSYLGGIVPQLQDHHPDASFMVFNFREGTKRSQISDILSQHDMTVMDYPRDYEGCPLLPLEMIDHFLRSSECWLTLEGQQNVVLMHCDSGGWPVLAFMLAALLLYRKLYNGERKTLEMIYKQAPGQILHLLTPTNSQPSHLRYLHYISRRNTCLDWPPVESPLSLDCIILRRLGGGRGFRPLVRLYGQDPSRTTYDRNPKLLFSTLKTNKQSRLYQQEECALVKLDIDQLVQGDVVLECVHLENDYEREEMMFRVMFHTAFIRYNVLMLTRDEVDVFWDAKDQFTRDFRAEVLFSSVDSGETKIASPEEIFEVQEIFNTHFFQESVQPPSPPPVPPTPLPSQDAVLISKAPPPPPPPPHLPSTYTQAAVSISILAQPPPPPPPPPPKLSSTYPPSVQESSEESENEEVAWKEELDKQKSEKSLTSTSRKQSISNTKLAAVAGGAKLKLKLQDSHGAQLGQAKPDAVSRWIPSNKGSYFDSIHVSHPPSRQKNTMKMETEGRIETKSASPEDFFEVEEIFSSVVDAKVNDLAHISSHRISLAGSPDIGDTVVSLTDQEEEIICRLMRGPSQRDIVSIVGMAGIGKTTLAKKVYNDPKIAYHFHRRAWCSVSQLYGKRELLLDIIKDIHGLPDEIHQMTDADLELYLCRKLKKIRYLIVMDDVWNIEALNELERSFPDDGAGSRILITSRFHNVASEAKPDSNPHMLRQLSDDESWDLLEMKSFLKGGGCPEELVEIGKEIARQCKGLPLAVVAVAGILERTKNKQDHWENIARRLSSQIIADPETRCKVILELSYMHLPCHLKACFLYFGAFSEDKEVPVSKLIRLWIAEGFIENNESKSLEDIAEDYLMDLINGSLVMISKRRSNGKVKACCVHGLFRDLCLSKAQEENFLQLITRYNEPYASFELFDYGSDFYDFYPSNPVTYESQRLCLHLKRKHFVSSKPSGPCTCSLIFSACSDTYPRRPYNVSFICHHFKLLKVLDLECINMGISLPVEIELLGQLRYLAVSGDMESIPRSIANLKLLETFIVKGLSGKVVLPDTIWCMKSLRHLHVSSYAVFNFQDEKIESSFKLDNLVSLSMPSLSHGKDSEKILRRLPNLRKLICVFLESWDSSMNCNQFPRLDCLTELESLEIVYFGRALNPGGFSFPLNLKKLTLSNFRLPWNKISAIGRLPNLEVLKLLFGAYEGLMWEMSEDEFPKLKFLKLDTLNIVQWNASYEHLPELEHLVLRNCQNLEEVPIDFAGIPTLQKIEVQGCKRSVEVSVRKIKEETEEIKVIIS